MKRISLEALVRKVDQKIFSPIKRDKGRPKWTLREVIKKDL